VSRYRIPQDELLALIDGVATDLHQTRYQTWDELRSYCRLVASVVGRMCVRIFGFDDPAALELADELGLALQLTNILRDVREDAQLGRIYIPGEDLARFGVAERDLLEGRSSAGWRELIDFETRRAQALFAHGVKVVPADTDRFGVGHGFNTSPSAGADAAITSATEKILAKARLLAGAATGESADALRWEQGAFVAADGAPQTIADIALYAHGTGALPPGVEGGLDAQTVYRD